MEYVSGNIYIRACSPDGLRSGEQVVGHKHNFDHTTYVKRGSFLIEQLDELGSPVFSKVISSEDEVNWILIPKGKIHRLTSQSDGSVYHCIYSHRLPQALTLHEPGQQAQPELTFTDKDGVVWYRSNDKIIDTSSWVEAYR